MGEGSGVGEGVMIEEEERSKPAVVGAGARIVYYVYEEHRFRIREVLTGTVRRRPRAAVYAVKGVSFIVHQGDVLGIVGSNGSGKSTLVSAIAGSLPLTSGEIYANSQPALLGVSAALKPELSGRRNIVLGLLALGCARNEIQTQVEEIIDFSGIRQSIDRPIKSYSNGMRARLQFAVSTSVRPSILLLDETLAVGDAEFKERSRMRIQELREGAGSVVLVSHNLAEIRRTCTRALWLHEGRVVLEGDPGRVIEAYEGGSEQPNGDD